MREAGCEIVRHYKDTAIMGFLTVLKNLDKIKANIEACHQDILAWRPDVVILVDYGGFNLRVAEIYQESGHSRILLYLPEDLGLEHGTGKENQAIGGPDVRDFPI